MCRPHHTGTDEAAGKDCLMSHVRNHHTRMHTSMHLLTLGHYAVEVECEGGQIRQRITYRIVCGVRQPLIPTTAGRPRVVHQATK